MNGTALDPPSGADVAVGIYYGEDRIRAAFRFAPGAAVLLYRLCYASATRSRACRRGRRPSPGTGWTGTGRGSSTPARASSSPTATRVPGATTCASCSDGRSMWEMFRAAPNFHRHALGPYRCRTPRRDLRVDPIIGARTRPLPFPSSATRAPDDGRHRPGPGVDAEPLAAGADGVSRGEHRAVDTPPPAPRRHPDTNEADA